MGFDSSCPFLDVMTESCLTSLQFWSRGKVDLAQLQGKIPRPLLKQQQFMLLGFWTLGIYGQCAKLAYF